VELPVAGAPTPRPPPVRAVMSTYMSPLELIGRGRSSPHPHAELKDMDEQQQPPPRPATSVTPQPGTAEANGAAAAPPRPASPTGDIVVPSAVVGVPAEDPVLTKLLAEDASIPWWKIGLITLVLCLFALVGVFRGSNTGNNSSTSLRTPAHFPLFRKEFGGHTELQWPLLGANVATVCAAAELLRRCCLVLDPT
jgi:hypothetical protein